MTNYDSFKQLHHQDFPLLLGNVWDAQSAKIFEKNGYPAVATSSAALARALGYEDGEEIPFRELLYVVERILASVGIPLSVDLEKGYSRDIYTIIDHVSALADAGAVGINIEDSMGKGAERKLETTDSFKQKIYTIKNHLVRNRRNVFINARTDAYVLDLPSAMEIAIGRAKAYEEAGADGLFVPFMKDESEIRLLTQETRLPLNVLCIPGLPSYEALSACGVKRISMGSSAFRVVYGYFDRLVAKISSEKSIALLF